MLVHTNQSEVSRERKERETSFKSIVSPIEIGIEGRREIRAQRTHMFESLVVSSHLCLSLRPRE